MENILYIVWDSVVWVWNSNFFGFLRFLAGVYTIVVVIDLILLLFLRDVSGNYIQGIYGANMPSSHKSAMQKRWKRVESLVANGGGTQYKVAILEADTIADETLALAKLVGSNMAERLQSATSNQVEHKDQLAWAHDIRNTIIRDETFAVDKDLVKKVIAVYRDFLESWEVL